MSRAGTPTDNPIDESLNGWIKDELFIDFNLKKCEDVLSLIKNYQAQLAVSQAVYSFLTAKAALEQTLGDDYSMYETQSDNE